MKLFFVATEFELFSTYQSICGYYNSPCIPKIYCRYFSGSSIPLIRFVMCLLAVIPGANLNTLFSQIQDIVDEQQKKTLWIPLPSN